MLQKQAFCKTCQRPSLFVKAQTEPNGMVILTHVVLTLVTCGLWLLVGIPYWIFTRPRYRCQACGQAG